MSAIDPIFFDKEFNVTRYMLRYVIGAATDQVRDQQLQKVRTFRAMADDQIVGVLDHHAVNLNTSLARFTSISNQFQDTRAKVLQVHQRAAHGKTTLSSKTRHVQELVPPKHEVTRIVDRINDIERLEAAPRQIDTLLTQQQFLEAVDEFTSAFEIVCSQQLGPFQATTGLRNELIACKQTIPDRLVQALQHTIYLGEAFTTIRSTANQSSLVAIETELCSENQIFDLEFETLLRRQHTRSKTEHQHRDRVLQYRVVPVAPLLPTNTLQTAVRAIQKLHREREVIGTIKSSIEQELDTVIVELSRLCRGIFVSTSTTSFANAFTHTTFGTHDHSKDLGTFLRLLFLVLRRITQRHCLVASYFEIDGDSGDYRIVEVITTISHVLERLLGDYFDCASSPQAAALNSAQHASPNSGQLFKLSRNKPPAANQTSEPHTGSWTRTGHCLVCEPSVFHLTEVYQDLECMGDFWNQLLPSCHSKKTHSPSSPSSSSLGFEEFLRTFATQKWIPKVKSKAHEYLAVKSRSNSAQCRRPIPSDTSYQPPSIDSLLHVIENLRSMMIKMPPYAADLASVLEASVLSWLKECVVIVRDIREPTLNHHQLQTKHVTYADIATLFHHYEAYQRAKQDSPIPYNHSKVQPAGSVSSFVQVNVEDLIAAKELELESELYDANAWMQDPKGLLMDNARIGMLGYANSACDLLALHLQRIARGSADENPSDASMSPIVPPAPTMALQAASWQCSALADECLLFLRREVRLHCCYYLTQLVSQRFDMDDDQPTVAQDTVLTLNLNLSAMENALQPYLKSDKMTFVFDGVDALLARLLIGNLSQMADCTFTRGGVQQMILNICALRQGLTGILYSYPRTSVSFSSTPSRSSSVPRLEHAKRYYQLLNLSEAQLELLLLANRDAYTHEAFRALWHVQAPHRPLSKDSVNKLHSLLR
ncbi:hypothetical protein PsorP6_004387 [Peronosclerospora sorghi]|uniref:Uncharacterized protein n=1 Tax=Peronosclerospora sorghi TaxID=230839 RepID=A0ACC0VJW9_9STRA|nr:hypothetical protein PsorP6_004387 [Peronosclerospora sorghi]